MSDIHEQRAELQKQVDQLKNLEAKGEKLPDETMHEVRTGVQMRNVLPLGEIMRGLVPKLQEIRDQCKTFEEDIVEKIQLLEKQYCDEHKIEVLVNQNETIKHSWQKQHLFVVYDPCLECKRLELQEREREFWIQRGVPWKVLHATFDNYKAECEAKQNAVSKFKRQLKRGKGFIFAIGSVGTGKTHLSVASMKSAHGGRFITMHDLVAELRATYQNHDEKFLTKYQEAKILVVDELSKDVYDPSLNKGLDIPPLLYRVLGYRYDHDLLTVITSNESLDDCLAILGPKLRDRIRENKTIVNFTWESNRKPENSESPRE